MRYTLLAAAVLALPVSVLAQKTSRSRASIGRNGQVKSVTTDNLLGYDDRPLHLGLYVAPNFSRYLIEQGSGYPNQEKVSANSIISPGFSVGFLGELRLGEYGAFTFAPGVSFLTRRIEFKDQGYVQDATRYPDDPKEIENQEIGSTQLDFPLLFKLKSQRRRNTRVYLIAGVKPSFNLGGFRKADEVKLSAADSDFAIEYGVGLDLFYPFFKFSPELRFSNGLKNLYVPSTNDVYSRSLQSMKSNTVTLYLNIWSGR